MQTDLPVVAYPKALHFGLLSPERIQEVSKVHVKHVSFGSQSNKHNMGLMDSRMGVDSRGALCQTCGGNNKDCPGHFGHLELALPIYDIGNMQHILHLLRCVCPHCSRLLLSRRDPYWKKLMGITHGKSRMKLLVKLCEKMPKCYYPAKVKGQSPEGCGLFLPTYKYLENVRIMVEFPVVYPHFSDETRFIITAERVRKIFEGIHPSDYRMLKFDEENARPEWMILTVLAVPPVCTRPSNKSNAAATEEDEITRKLQEIAHWNTLLKQLIDELEFTKRCLADPEWMNEYHSSEVAEGTRLRDVHYLEGEIVKTTNMLQMTVSYYMDSKSISPQQKGRVIGKTNKQSKGWAQMFGHKDGLFRGHLMGKRDDFTSRTVISPDPNIDLDEVGVPYSVAKTLTYKERVTALNIERLEQMVKNGPDLVFGANAVILQDGKKIDLKIADRLQTVLSNGHLQFGDEVERHMMDGDINVFNRQPSLHRMSIMGHKARILPYSTFRLNLSVTTPYNAVSIFRP